MERAVTLALETENKGNVPVGAVISLDGRIIAEGANSMFSPVAHPGKHAEQVALQAVPTELWRRVSDMVCYSTLEPCPMCLGSLLIYGFGRIVYGSKDELGGGVQVIPHLPRFFTAERLPVIDGPVMTDVCDPIAKRVIDYFST